MPAEIYRNRRLIWKLAKNDFKVRYAGSYFGAFWAFVQPVITILVYWFVFSVGFRVGTRGIPVPFVLYLVGGIVPWFYFQDSLTGGTNALLEYHYLVKKVVFHISVLPAVKLVSSLFVHGFFVLVTLILYACYGLRPDIYCLQLIYYSFAMILLVAGLTSITSAVVVFFRDLQQIIAIFLQVGVWLTPIMWVAENTLADRPVIRRILMLNPMYYIVSGYRDSLIYKRWFWQNPLWTLYFWAVTILLLLLGNLIFARLRQHFADVL